MHMLDKCKAEEKYFFVRVGILVVGLVVGSCLSQKSPAQAGHLDPKVQFPPSGSSTEHLDVISLSGNDLHADQPLLGERVVLPTYIRELIRVQWRENDPIDLYVIRPVGVARPPVILFLYSFPSESDRFRSEALCEKLTKDGFAAVGFVSALTGQRYHDRPMREWFVSKLQESLVASVHDVQMILNYLATRDDLDMGRVGMFGQGSGGTIAVLSAAVDSRIKAVDLLDPWGDWPDWLAKSPQVPEEERQSYLTPEFLAGIAPLDPIGWLPQLESRPLRLQENLFNAAIPDKVRQRIEAATPASARIVEYHSTEEYAKKVSTNARMLDWLHVQLQSLPGHSLKVKESLPEATKQ